MIRITNLKKKYSDDFTLSVPSLAVEPGERVVLIGPNGSGKSTLLRLLAGVIKPDEGKIEISFPADRVGYQPQSPYVFKGTVESNVRLGRHGGADIPALLASCGLEQLQRQRASLLSGGERQRMCLCRILAGNYRMLLLDEPFSAADIDSGELLEQVLLQYCAENDAGLVMATHLPSQAFRLATKLLILHRGEIVEYGSIQELKTPKSEFGQKFLSQWKWG